MFRLSLFCLRMERTTISALEAEYTRLSRCENRKKKPYRNVCCSFHSLKFVSSLRCGAQQYSILGGTIQWLKRIFYSLLSFVLAMPQIGLCNSRHTRMQSQNAKKKRPKLVVVAKLWILCWMSFVKYHLLKVISLPCHFINSKLSAFYSPFISFIPYIIRSNGLWPKRNSTICRCKTICATIFSRFADNLFSFYCSDININATMISDWICYRARESMFVCICGGVMVCACTLLFSFCLSHI